MSPRLKSIAKRLVRAVRPPPQRRVRGVIDRVVGRSVVGWAVSVVNPGRPLRVRLVSLGISVEGIAEDKRADVAAAGFGTAYCGFQLRLPDGFDMREGTELRLVDAASG